MIYYSMLILIVILGIVFRRSKKLFMISAGSLLFLFQACRKYYLWGDLIRYSDKHLLLAQYKTLSGVYNEILIDSKDAFFYFLEWIATRCGVSFRIWLAIIAFVFVFSVCRLIYKKSVYPLISVLAFLALGYFSFSLSGLRQTMAMSIVIWSFYALEKNKKFRFILFVILATLCHKSAIVFLLILPVARIKLGKWHVLAALLGGLGFTVFRPQVRLILNAVLSEGQYAWYGSSDTTLNFAGFIIQCAIFCFCLFYYRRVTKNKNNRILYNLSFAGVVLQLYAAFIAEFFRLSMYFSIFNIILIPLAVKQEKDRRTKEVFLLLIALTFLLYIISNGAIRYEFFWR